ncbi:MAG TPA: hypothetical protein VGR35_15410 [Tepidisphaeraceae bacterium]|nr:hypothetical protein [Tepidisphaeraceae bacterium]
MSDEPKKPTVASLLFHLAFAAWGIYLIAKPGSVGIFQGTLAVLLIIFGVGMFLLGIVARFAQTPSEAAASLSKMERELYTPVHEKRRVDGETTIHEYRLDRDFYRTRTAELEAARFRTVGDYVDVTAEQATSWARAVIRTFIGDNGTTMAAIFDVRIRGFVRFVQLLGVIARDMRSVEFETEFTDGRFACTSNAVSASKTTEVPGISRLFLPLRSTTRELLDAHHAHVARLLNEKPGVTPIRVATFADVEASQDRMQAMKSRFRRSAEFNSVEETERIMGRPLSADQRRAAEEAEARRRAADAAEQPGCPTRRAAQGDG